MFFVFFEIGFGQLRNNLVDRGICIGGVFCRPGNDQRRPCLIDEDVVDLIDDGIVKFALDHFLDTEIHIVAQIVEAEFVIRAVGDVAGIGCLAFRVVEPMRDAADGQAKEFEDRAHPVGIA